MTSIRLLFSCRKQLVFIDEYYNECFMTVWHVCWQFLLFTAQCSKNSGIFSEFGNPVKLGFDLAESCSKISVWLNILEILLIQRTLSFSLYSEQTSVWAEFKVLAIFAFIADIDLNYNVHTKRKIQMK